MKRLIYYFYPKIKVSYFEKLKTLFFINLAFFGILLLFSSIILDFWSSNANFLISVTSKLLEIALLTSSLFILKKKGIRFAGNFFSFMSVIVTLVAMNVIPQNLEPIYKFIQGFYSIFLFLIIGLLFATRPIIIINSVLSLITTTHIYLYSIYNYADKTHLYTVAYIYHTVVLFGITVVIFYANKFTDLTITKSNKEIEHRKMQNMELLSSEEEIRAANEELVATTDALVESNNELSFAIEKAEESNRLKTEFLNNMSHEVRTPLNGIMGFSQLLGISSLDKKSQEEYINIIQKSGNQLLLIIDSIIEISKLGIGQVDVVENEVNINAMLKDLNAIFNLKACESKILLSLKCEFADNQSNVIIDELKLFKILNNLLENALKFTEKGSVEFGYYHLKSNHGLKAGMEAIRFFVKDTGIGIEIEKQELIFDKFSQAESSLSRQYGGLGLGLSIAKENAKLLGGSIGLNSERGVGSTFFLTIPYVPISKLS